jgi:hypothetical protein
MAGLRKWQGSASWLPLALVLAVFAGLIGVFLLGLATPPAHGGPSAPEVTAGFQTTERLILTVNLPAHDKGGSRGTLVVQLIDADGKVLDDPRKDVVRTQQARSYRFELAGPKRAADRVMARCRLNEQKHEVELKKILLVKAHETSLSVGKEFFAGSAAGLRCEVHGVKSMTQTVPLAGAAVTIQLKVRTAKLSQSTRARPAPTALPTSSFRCPNKRRPDRTNCKSPPNRRWAKRSSNRT